MSTDLTTEEKLTAAALGAGLVLIAFFVGATVASLVLYLPNWVTAIL